MGLGGGWIAMTQSALMALAKGNFGAEAYRVLCYVMAVLDFENWIYLNQSELSEKLKMKRQNFNRALLKLENEKILLRGPRIGGSKTFRLNPNYGKASNMEAL
jgi:DNA-binding MarR family transcriptional regulator